MIHFNDWKEVWYVWDGDTAVRAAIKDIGQSYIGDFRARLHASEFSTYTTGEMRRRVECPVCEGYGETVFSDYCSSDGVVDKSLQVCLSCDGRGYLWEYK